MGVGPWNVGEQTGTRWEERRLSGTRWERAGVRGECRKVDAAEVEAVIRCVRGIPQTVFTGRDPFLKWERKRSAVDKGGGRVGKGVGEEPERGGVPSEVDPARGPARRVTGTQGTGRREPLRPRAQGTGHRGGKRGEAGRLYGARGIGVGMKGEGVEGAAATGARGAGEAGGAEPWARGEGMGEEGGGVSQAIATEPTVRTGETGAGGGAAGGGRPRTAGAAARRPAGGGGLNAGSNQGQTFLLRVFLLNWARIETGKLRTSST